MAVQDAEQTAVQDPAPAIAAIVDVLLTETVGAVADAAAVAVGAEINF